MTNVESLAPYALQALDEAVSGQGATALPFNGQLDGQEQLLDRHACP